MTIKEKNRRKAYLTHMEYTGRVDIPVKAKSLEEAKAIAESLSNQQRKSYAQDYTSEVWDTIDASCEEANEEDHYRWESRESLSGGEADSYNSFTAPW